MVSVWRREGGGSRREGWVVFWPVGEGKKAEFPYCSLPFLHNAHNQH